MSEIRAVFEAALWKDFSKEHRALREELAVLGRGEGSRDWTHPVYFHLNDLLDGVSAKPPPEGFRDHARAFVARLVETLRSDPGNELLRKTYRDEALLSYILERLDEVDRTNDKRPEHNDFLLASDYGGFAFSKPALARVRERERRLNEARDYNFGYGKYRPKPNQPEKEQKGAA